MSESTDIRSLLGTSGFFLLLVLPLVPIYWLAGFYPQDKLKVFDNRAQWEGAQALNFAHYGVAFTAESSPWWQEAIRSETLDIRFEAQAKPTSRPVTVILAVGSMDFYDLSIEQHKRALIVSFRGKAPQRIVTLRFADVFVAPQWQRVHVTVTASTVRVFVNEVLQKEMSLQSSPFVAWRDDVRPVLGNTFGFDQPWHGKLRDLRIESGSKTYVLMHPEDWQLPRLYLPTWDKSIRKFFLIYRKPVDAAVIFDWVINLLGFVPLGALVAFGLLPRRSAWLSATLFCFAVSLTIETGQFLTLTRTPSVVDLVLNSGGGFVGGVVVAILLRRRLSPRYM